MAVSGVAFDTEVAAASGIRIQGGGVLVREFGVTVTEAA